MRKLKRYPQFDNCNLIEIIVGCVLMALPFLMIIARL